MAFNIENMLGTRAREADQPCVSTALTNAEDHCEMMASISLNNNFQRRTHMVLAEACWSQRIDFGM